MKVRRQLQLVRWGVYFACATLVIVAAWIRSLGPAWFAVALAFMGAPRFLRRLNARIGSRAMRRLTTLIAEERFAQAHAHLADLRHVYAGSKAALELLRMQEGTVLVFERRYADAIRLLDSVDRGRLQKNALPWLLNNLAWALVRAQQGERAVAVARESIAAAAETGDRAASTEDLRACQLGTLGAALVVAGKPDEAIEPLEQALVRGGSARLEASRSFYLGDALHALGREIEARAAWKRAAESWPTGDIGATARERLDAPAPPYRS